MSSGRSGRPCCTRRRAGRTVGQVGEGVDADGRDFELAVQGAAVEGLDVLELVDELEAAGVELVVGQGVEHEGVVGVGAVPDPDRAADGGGAHGGSARSGRHRARVAARDRGRGGSGRCQRRPDPRSANRTSRGPASGPVAERARGLGSVSGRESDAHFGSARRRAVGWRRGLARGAELGACRASRWRRTGRPMLSFSTPSSRSWNGVSLGSALAELLAGPDVALDDQAGVLLVEVVVAVVAGARSSSSSQIFRPSWNFSTACGKSAVL